MTRLIGPINTAKFCPSFLPCPSLQSNDNDERLQVVKLLAKMFGAKDSELAAQNKPLWQCYLGRWVGSSLRKPPSTHVQVISIFDTLKGVNLSSQFRITVVAEGLRLISYSKV